MYAQPERTEVMGKALGMEPPPSVRSASLEDTFREMDEAHIDIGVIPVRRGTEILGDVSNDEVAQFIDQHSDRFVGFAAPSVTNPSIAEIDRLASLAAFRGLVFEPGMWRHPLYANDRRLYPLYEHCQELGRPVLIMGGGNAGPDISYNVPLLLDQICADFPRMTVIAAHGGWPWVHEALHVAFRRRNLYLSPDMYLFGMAGWRDYVDAGNGFLQDRFLFGTAYPFVPLGPAVKRFREMFEPRVHSNLLGENALRVLGISEAEQQKFRR
jgi:predicted TIM-barrel fold metal-dependent hydrolase